MTHEVDEKRMCDSHYIGGNCNNKAAHAYYDLEAGWMFVCCDCYGCDKK